MCVFLNHTDNISAFRKGETESKSEAFVEGGCCCRAQSAVTDNWDKIKLVIFYSSLSFGCRKYTSLSSPSISRNLKSSRTDGRLGAIIQHLAFARFVRRISQDKDFNPHKGNPVIYKFNSSTYRKSQFHGLCLGVSPRACRSGVLLHIPDGEPKLS